MSDAQMPDLTEHLDDGLLWQLTGARSGPTLLVTGDLQKLAPVVERLQLLPSLVYLRGTLKVGGPEGGRRSSDVEARLCVGFLLVHSCPRRRAWHDLRSRYSGGFAGSLNGGPRWRLLTPDMGKSGLSCRPCRNLFGFMPTVSPYRYHLSGSF